MPATRRTTVYLERKVYRALKARAKRTRRRLSTIVNEELAEILMNEQGHRAFRRTRKERSIPLEEVVRELKRDGRL